MKTQANNKNKSNPFLLSNQVKRILQKRGLSKAFNYSDYNLFKEYAKSAFNKAQTIADNFIQEHQDNSDFNEYTF
jgi:hypothetical protein